MIQPSSNVSSITIPLCIGMLFVTPIGWWPFILFLLILYVQKNTTLFSTLTQSHTTKSQRCDHWSDIEKLLREKYTLKTYSYIDQYTIELPVRIKYIKRDEVLSSLVLRMWTTCKRYHAYGCIDIIILIENFMKMHFHTLLELYDAGQYIPILYDIQKDIDIACGELSFNVPNSVQVKIVSKLHTDIVRITSHYMTIIHNKFVKKHEHLYAFTCS